MEPSSIYFGLSSYTFGVIFIIFNFITLTNGLNYEVLVYKIDLI